MTRANAFIHEQLRAPFTLALLIAVPVVFVAVAAGVLSDFARALGGDLAGDLRALTLTGPRANAALRSAVATTLAVLVALALHLDNPWWAGISGVVLVQSDRAATLARSVDRVIGTMIGATIGFFGAGLAEHHLAFLSLAAGFTALRSAVFQPFRFQPATQPVMPPRTYCEST